MHFHTIIIGAGPAGLFAAQALGQNGKSVLVLERNQRAGRKLLISGAGQCNFTHAGNIGQVSLIPEDSDIPAGILQNIRLYRMHPDK